MSEIISVNKIKTNPENPRIIKDDNFKKLVKSLKEFPVMLHKRKIMLDENNIIIGGNMRYKAAVEAGIKEVPIEHFTREDAENNNKITGFNKTYEQYVEEFIIKDNVSGGEWDYEALANKWDKTALEDWGVELPKIGSDEQEIELVTKNVIEVSLDDPVDLQELYDELIERGYKCKILTL